jgi:hypothetical protein
VLSGYRVETFLARHLLLFCQSLADGLSGVVLKLDPIVGGTEPTRTRMQSPEPILAENTV